MNKKIINLTKFRCPELIIKLRGIIRNIHENEIVHIIIDDISSKRDIEYFFHFMGHVIISCFFKKKYFIYVIKVGKKINF